MGQRGNRKEQILQALARLLERGPGERITTAALAREVGVSEAALYRHFPSKAKMFEALIAFAEDTVFTLANRIHEQERGPARRCLALVQALLAFADKNPGISRLLAGDALVGEAERLRLRVDQFYRRLETQLRQFLREGALEGKAVDDPAALANLLLAVAEGRIHQFVRSGFAHSPMAHWPRQRAWLAALTGEGTPLSGRSALTRESA